MKCLSCQVELEKAVRWRALILCSPCCTLAEKADADLKAVLRRSEEQALQWLEQHVMRGGLLKGGSGT